MFCSDSGYCWGGSSPCVDNGEDNTTVVEVNASLMGYTCCDNVQRRAIRGDFFPASNLTDCLGVCDEASDCAGIEWYTAYLDAKPCLVVTEWETKSSTPQVADSRCLQDTFAASWQQSTVGTTQLCGLTVPVRVEDDPGTVPSTTTKTRRTTTTTIIAAAGTGGRSAAGAALSPAMLGVVVAGLLAIIFFMVAYGCWWRKEKKKKKPLFERHEPKAPHEDHCATIITQDPILAFKLDEHHQRHPNVYKNISVMQKAVQARRQEFLGEKEGKVEDPELGFRVKPLGLPKQQEPADGKSDIEKTKRPPPVWHRPREALRRGKKEPETPIVAVSLDVGSHSHAPPPVTKVFVVDDVIAEDVDADNDEDLAKIRADAQSAYTALGLERFRLRTDVVGVKAVGDESPRSPGSPVSPAAELKERDMSAPLPMLQSLSPGSSKQPIVQQRDASAPIHYRGGELASAESPSNIGLRALAAPSPKDAWGVVSPGVPPSLETGPPGGDHKKARRMAAVVIMSVAERKAEDSMVNLREVSEELKGHQHEAFMDEVLQMNRKRGYGDFISLEDLGSVLEACVTKVLAGAPIASTLPQLRVT